MFKHLLPPDDFHTMTPHEKFDSIISRMQDILQMERVKFFRDRFATPEQFAAEYPEDYEHNLAVVFRLIKDNYINNFDEINEVAKKIEDADLFRILKNIVDTDIDKMLLGEEDEREEV